MLWQLLSPVPCNEHFILKIPHMISTCQVLSPSLTALLHVGVPCLSHNGLLTPLSPEPHPLVQRGAERGAGLVQSVQGWCRVYRAGTGGASLQCSQDRRCPTASSRDGARKVTEERQTHVRILQGGTTANNWAKSASGWL